MKLELRKKGVKGFTRWGISVEESTLTTWADPAKPQQKDHGEPWKAALAAGKEIRKKMLAGFFLAAPEAEDVVYDGAFKQSAVVLDFHPTGASIAVAQIHDDARGADIVLVDLATGDRRTAVTFPADAGQTFVHTLRFDASGERLFVALNGDTLAVTVAGGAVERLTTPSFAMNGQGFEGASMVQSDHARRRFTAQDGDDLVVRDDQGRTLLRRDARHATRAYQGVRLSPSGRFLALQILGRAIQGRAPDKTNVIELWSVDEGKLLRTLDIRKQAPVDPPYDTVERAVFADDEKTLLFTFVPGDRGFYALPVDGATPCVALTSKVHTHGSQITDLCLEGQTLAIAGQGDVRFFRWPELELLRTAEGDIARYLAVRFSDDGRLVASGNSWGRIVARKAVTS